MVEHKDDYEYQWKMLLWMASEPNARKLGPLDLGTDEAVKKMKEKYGWDDEKLMKDILFLQECAQALVPIRKEGRVREKQGP